MYKYDTLFLDRDGVINKKLEGNYVCSFKSFEFMPNALLAISKLSRLFNRIIIVTNQQCIGKKIISKNELNEIHELMLKQIKKNSGYINKIYYCPHLVKEFCSCRKPKTGMIQQAIIDFPEIIISDSYLVGDSVSDIEAGNAMKLKTVRVDSIYTLSSWTKTLLKENNV
jgi:D-glycero-D-manno-heptose 1,7-bisphosphate phosphatase